MNNYMTILFFALCIGVSAYSSWQYVVSMPSYQSAHVQHSADM